MKTTFVDQAEKELDLLADWEELEQ